jgi:hypothetical protein
MKKTILVSLFALFLSLGFSFNYVLAVGTIQLVNFPSSFNESIGYSFSIPINFIYSGSNSNELGVSIVGPNNSLGSLPPGVTLGPIDYGTNGVDNIYLSGNPKTAGNYPLTLFITDGNGALLNQSFNFSVSINTFTLPNAIVNKNYYQNLPVGYSNLDNAIVGFSAWQDGIQNSNLIIGSIRSTINNGSAVLELIPLKVGQYDIEADIIIGNDVINTETFKLVVVDSAVSAPSNTSIPVQIINQNTPPTAIQTPIVVPIVNSPILKKEATKDKTTTNKITLPTVNIPVVQPVLNTKTVSNTSSIITPETVKKNPWYRKIFNWFIGK